MPVAYPWMAQWRRWPHCRGWGCADWVCAWVLHLAKCFIGKAHRWLGGAVGTGGWMFSLGDFLLAMGVSESNGVAGSVQLLGFS